MNKEKLMLALLRVARCPACDGSGAYYQGSNDEPDVVQCQWCDERNTLLSEIDKTADVEGEQTPTVS